MDKKKSPYAHSVCWQSPSNIALTKYWGKYGNQLPQNPSLSFTLSQAHTKTTISYENRDTQASKFEFNFFFEGEENLSFKNRINKYLNNNSQSFEFLLGYNFDIESENSFPHSSGIASSASSMSALVLALLSLKDESCDLTQREHIQEASNLSRLASGSACRSLFPKAALWGKCQTLPGSSNEYAVGMSEFLHQNFIDYHDDILIVSAETKHVSSSMGHDLMLNNRFAQERYKQANTNTENLIRILEKGELMDFVSLVESEALTLHALMMTGKTPFILMKPHTLEIIQNIQDFRRSTNIPICFTLDAGPNVHVLYPKNYATPCQEFIHSELKPWCYKNRIISDKMGNGPLKIS